MRKAESRALALLGLCAAVGAFSAGPSSEAQGRKPAGPIQARHEAARQKGKSALQGDAVNTGPFKLAGPSSGIRKERFVWVRNGKALADLLKEHNPYGEFHTSSIDFKKYDVVGYFAGTKPTGGFSVEFVGVNRQKDGAVIKFCLIKPGRGSMVTQALTSPFLIQAVDKLPQHVSHTVTEQERGSR